jgi:hypothetical protein
MCGANCNRRAARRDSGRMFRVADGEHPMRMVAGSRARAVCQGCEQDYNVRCETLYPSPWLHDLSRRQQPKWKVHAVAPSRLGMLLSLKLERQPILTLLRIRSGKLGKNAR